MSAGLHIGVQIYASLHGEILADFGLRDFWLTDWLRRAGFADHSQFAGGFENVLSAVVE